MSIMPLLSRLEELDIRIVLENDQLKINSPKGKLAPALVNELKEKKQEIIEFLQQNAQRRVEYVSVEPAEKKEYYSLSSTQKRLYFLQQMDRGSSVYNIPNMIEQDERPDPDRLEKTFRNLIKRHEALRTSFRLIGETPVQEIHRHVDFEIQWLESTADKNVESLSRDFIKPFDLSQAPLLRVGIVNGGNEKYLLMTDMHHIISDNISNRILLKDFVSLYNGKEPAPLKLQYKDYAEWQNRKSRDDSFKKLEDYWLKEFSEDVPVLNLPVDYPRLAATRNFEGSNFFFEIPHHETKALKDASRERGLTLFTTVFAIFNILISKLGDKEDIVLGTPVFGRGHADLETIIGMFVNTLVIRNYPSGEKTFESFLQELNQRLLSAFENQEYPFEELVDNVVRNRDTSRNPLFDVMFAFLNADVNRDAPPVENPAPPVEEYAGMNPNPVSRFDMSWYGVDRGNTLFFTVEYRTALFKEETVRRFVNSFRKIISTVIDDTGRKISGIEIISEEEKKQVLVDFNSTKIDYPGDKTVHRLFVEQAEKMPDRIALVGPFPGEGPGDERSQITYREIDRYTDRLSIVLQTRGVAPGHIVGVMAGRTIEMVTAMLAVLKAGGAYLPLDAKHPGERTAYMLRDSSARLLVTTAAFVEEDEKLSMWKGETILSGIKDLRKDLRGRPSNQPDSHNPRPPAGPLDLAYVIYTSGSTGKPKGVMIEHRNVLRLVTRSNYIQWTENDRLLLTGAPIFDITTFEIWGPLLNGLSLYLIEEKELLNEKAFKTFVIKNHISILHLIPQLLSQYVLRTHEFEIFAGLKYFLTGGDMVRPRPVNHMRHENKDVNVLHMYGPTENTTFSTFFPVEEYYEQNIPIGKPVGNSSVYVIDKHGKLTPIGVPGELIVGGEGVARGYLNNPGLTAEKFVRGIVPFTPTPVYRTGDLARWLPDGNIEFLGRIDQQVKVRGIRIELGEIETVLLQHEGIDESVVTARQINGENHLAAYYKKKKKIELWPSLAEYYMINDDLVYHSMTHDELRNEKYMNALKKVLKDKVVLEIGPGKDAVLSRMCIDAGAKKVFAVEIQEEVCRNAEKTIKNLGLEDKIILIHGDITKTELPEKVDYCVSEIVGSIGGSEGAAKIINSSQKFLKDPRHMIPSRSLTKIAAISLSEDEFDYCFEEVGAHYTENIFDYFGSKFDLRLCLYSFPEKNIISTTDVFEDLDFTRENPLEHEHEIHLEILDQSIMKGFAVWLVLYCDQEEVIDTLKKKYIWLPIYFPVFPGGETVRKGDYIRARIVRKLSKNRLNPDFTITGTLHRKEGTLVDFVYHSDHLPSTFKGDPFYERVFSHHPLRIGKSATSAGLRQFLSDKLPDYMVPSYFMELDEFPLTPNGKIDRKALPEPGIEAADLFIPPQNEAEKRLCEIWSEILGIEEEKIGTQHNYFQLGGNSLNLIRLASKIYEEFNVELPIDQIYENPTIKGIADGITATEHAESPVTLLNPGVTTGKKIFCFPPQMAYGFVYTRLSHMVDYSFYAFYFIEEEDRIKKYVDIITRIQPAGPYIFLGLSAAGPLTFSVAAELERQGYEVTDIIFLDCYHIPGITYEPPTEEYLGLVHNVIKNFLEETGASYYKDKVVRKVDKYIDYYLTSRSLEKINADVHLIASDMNKDIETLRCWDKLTNKGSFVYEGVGPHDKMIEPGPLETNAEIIRKILRKNKSY